MKTGFVVVAVAGLAAVASAQNGRLTWEVSRDGGTTWNGGLTRVETSEPTSVLVRAVASWSGVTNSVGLAGSSFDGVLSGVKTGDRASGFVRGVVFSAQTIVTLAMGGGVVKIDDERDTFAPGFSGTGQRSINPSQGVPELTPGFVTRNPLVVFSYTLGLGTELGVRNISSVFNTSGVSNVRAMVVWVTQSGSSISIPAARIAVDDAFVEVAIPSPGAGVVLGFGAILVGRRRR
jgi:hypothetical protein